MLDVSRSLEEEDGDDVPSLVVQLGEGGLLPISMAVRVYFSWRLCSALS